MNTVPKVPPPLSRPGCRDLTGLSGTLELLNTVLTAPLSRLVPWQWARYRAMAATVIRYSIAYRDFYDVPRTAVVFAGDERLLLDCPFDEEREDYPAVYQVFRLPNGYAPPSGSWTSIVEDALEHLGAIDVASVRFDERRREAVRADALRPFLARAEAAAATSGQGDGSADFCRDADGLHTAR